MFKLHDKALDAIRKEIKTSNRELALALLEQCQDLAIQIGGMIEESLGEDFATIEVLENYCEQIYQTYVLIEQRQPINANKTQKSLKKTVEVY